MTNNLSLKTEEAHINLLIDVIRKNGHIISKLSDNELHQKTYAFSSRVVFSKNIDFLEAVHKEMDGEIISNKTIGPFLYIDLN
jgi:sporulation protein YlmC with PRC-barrel domain